MKLSIDQWGGIVRTVLAVIAGYVISRGWADADLVYGVSGLLGAIAVGGWSLVQKYLSAKALGDGSEVTVAADAVKAALAILAKAAEQAAVVDAKAKAVVAETAVLAVQVAAPVALPAPAEPVVEATVAEPVV